MELTQDFDESFSSLIAHSVEFLVVGGYALAYHGAPRYTGDIEVLVKPTLDNAERLMAALQSFGFPTHEFGPDELIAPDRILQMGFEPVQIHVMSAITGVSWDDAWAGRNIGRCGTHDLPFIGRREFVLNKRASGRLKDLADVEALGGE
jgi:hypothetical protein